MMNQILMAAARGARVQRQDDRGFWVSTNVLLVEPVFDEVPKRVHPNDEHLRFGPISSELREYDDRRVCIYDFDCRIQYYMHEYMYPNEVVWDCDAHHRSLFLLILAEALADEGL